MLLHPQEIWDASCRQWWTQPHSIGILYQGECGAGGGLLKHLDVMALFAPSMAFGGQLSVSVNLPNLVHNSSWCWSHSEGSRTQRTGAFAYSGGRGEPFTSFPGACGAEWGPVAQCPLLQSFFAVLRLQVASFPKHLKLCLWHYFSSLPVVMPVALDSKVSRNKVSRSTAIFFLHKQMCKNSLKDSLKIRLHSFPFLLPSPRKYSPDSFENHLCCIAHPCWVLPEAPFLFWREGL